MMGRLRGDVGGAQDGAGAGVRRHEGPGIGGDGRVGVLAGERAGGDQGQCHREGGWRAEGEKRAGIHVTGKSWI